MGGGEGFANHGEGRLLHMIGRGLAGGCDRRETARMLEGSSGWLQAVRQREGGRDLRLIGRVESVEDRTWRLWLFSKPASLGLPVVTCPNDVRARLAATGVTHEPWRNTASTWLGEAIGSMGDGVVRGW